MIVAMMAAKLRSKLRVVRNNDPFGGQDRSHPPLHSMQIEGFGRPFSVGSLVGPDIVSEAGCSHPHVRVRSSGMRFRFAVPARKGGFVKL